jgi:hypothetical protein
MAAPKTTKPKAEPANDAPPVTVLMIDNFDDQDLELNPAWWHFDKVEFSFVPNSQENISKLGSHYLKVSGSTNDWYIGGMGTYLAIDVSQFKGITMAVNGFGPTSGRIKIELYDDDNGSNQLEQDSSFQPLFDDKFQYELTVNWTGWQQITIPFSKFVDMNPAVGNLEGDSDRTLHSIDVHGTVHTGKETSYVRFPFDIDLNLTVRSRNGTEIFE